MRDTTNHHPDLPSHKTIYLKVVEGPDGFHPFLLIEGSDGTRTDILPIRETPPIPIYQLAEELAIVLAWQFLDLFQSKEGEPYVNVLD